ncbi:unnamed protein product [Caenorhabditis auriculariae]|uniref:Uncharacterized protein n=1 Tax=Caenorhabditis auriculariae TaxID=2777116 RepID=A0A8S1H6I3_9PELO|nr:unnamed protein product [Caenorhabditis auriculariae]
MNILMTSLLAVFGTSLAMPSDILSLARVDGNFSEVEAQPAPSSPSELLYFAYAVDIFIPASVSQLTCLKKSQYSALFVRAYRPEGQGFFDPNCVTTIQNAVQVGINVEIYMTPQAVSNKSGSQQLEEVYYELQAQGITVRSIWIQVVSPEYWSKDHYKNTDFINSIITRATQFGLVVGIYTSHYDWYHITNSYSQFNVDINLWYYHVFSDGPRGETKGDFSDFLPFGPWITPFAKQFGQMETICALNPTNRDAYALANTKARAAQEKKSLALSCGYKNDLYHLPSVINDLYRKTMLKLAALLSVACAAVLAMPSDHVLPFVAKSFPIKFAEVIAEPAPAVTSNSATYQYAVDFAVPASTSQLSCLKQAGYSAIFIRAYSPAGQGTFDTNSCQTIMNAAAVGLGVEAYITPQPSSSKQGYQQLDETYQGLTSRGITVRSIWIQVTSPANWPGTATSHVNFLNSMITRAQQYGLAVGIYTSYYDWNQITNGWTNVGSQVMVWYWSVFGGGVSGESPANFSDFRPFGNWKTATAKQFAQVETVCQLTVNRDVYAVGMPRLADAVESKSEGPVVGFLGH